MNNIEIQAILTLLEDPDVQVYESISETLLKKGPDVVPELEKAWEVTGNTLTQGRLENIIHHIQQNFVNHSLSSWIRGGALDLLEGAFVICRHQYPDIVFEDIKEPIEKMKHDIQMEINDNLTALEKVRIFNHIFFEINKFTGNNSNYYAPQNSYINQVLLSRKGSPVSLGLIYSSIAQKLGLPIYGVNLPKNFILAYKDEFYDLLDTNAVSDSILFYINPHNKGAILGRKEIDQFLQQQNIKPQESYYQTCSNLEIIQRLLLNLIYSYEKLGNSEKMNDLKKLLKISRFTK